MHEKTILIRLLEKADDRNLFHSGDIELDRFFQRYAGQNQFRHYIGTNYIALLEERIVGFVTVANSELASEKISVAMKKRLSDYPVPVLRIARIAVDKNFQGLGIGKKLLAEMFRLALKMKQQAGCVGVVVDAKPDAVSFYQALGFAFLDIVGGELGDRPQTIPMFISLKLIEKADGVLRK